MKKKARDCRKQDVQQKAEHQQLDRTGERGTEVETKERRDAEAYKNSNEAYRNSNEVYRNSNEVYRNSNEAYR